jgi:hypothetical protein
MKFLVSVAILTFALLSGCATNETRNSDNYQTYLKSVTEIQNGKVANIQATNAASNAQFAADATACAAAGVNTQACIQSVASYQAISAIVSSLSQGAAGGQVNVAPPQREPSLFEKVAPVLGAALPVLGNAFAVHENVRAQISANQTNASVQIANTNAWSGAVNAVASHPTTYVGGNLGDTYGDNYTGGNRTDNSGTLVNGNQNRITSPNTGGTGGNCPGGTSGASGAGGAGGDNGATSGTSGATAPTGGGGNCSGGTVGG